MLTIAGIRQGDVSQQAVHQFSHDILRLLTYVHQLYYTHNFQMIENKTQREMKWIK